MGFWLCSKIQAYQILQTLALLYGQNRENHLEIVRLCSEVNTQKVIKDFLRNHAAVLFVTGISLTISFMVAGSVDNVWAPHRGR
jgi:hypothetical protein